MTLAKVIFPLACGWWLTGCSIRPLPEQVTGIKTFDIVKQIRCETREAVYDSFTRALTENPGTFGEPAQSVAQGYRGHPELMSQFKPTLFTGPARDFVNYFWNTGIAYNFTLDMTEINNLDATLDLGQVLTGSTRTLALGGGVDRTRENTRTFTITDDFHSLLNLRPHDYCDDHLAVDENQIYPITGKVGVESFVQEFMRIALFGSLGLGKDSTAPTMVDTLIFTTTIAGSAAPKIVFAPIGRAVQVADASFTAAATRKDVHTLTMGLSVVAGPVADAKSGNKLFGRLLTSSGGGTRRTAADAVDQELTRQALSRTIVVHP